MAGRRSPPTICRYPHKTSQIMSGSAGAKWLLANQAKNTWKLKECQVKGLSPTNNGGINKNRREPVYMYIGVATGGLRFFGERNVIWHPATRHTVSTLPPRNQKCLARYSVRILIDYPLMGGPWRPIVIARFVWFDITADLPLKTGRSPKCSPRLSTSEE